MKKQYIKTNLVFAALFIVLLFIDQMTKRWAAISLMRQDRVVIPNVLTFHYLENAGAAWGIFQNAIWLFAIITVVVMAVILYLYVKLPFERHYLYLRTAVIVLAAGAIGNFIDRALMHYVVDFINLSCIHFPVFNVADCFVCISAICLLHALLFYYKDEDFICLKKK